MITLSRQAKAEKAFAIHQELIQLGNAVGQTFILIGKKLKEIKDSNLFKYLGDGGYDTFEAYLGSPELQMSRRQAFYLIKIYTTFCEQLGVNLEQMNGAKVTALKEILPVVNQDNYEEWLDKTKMLSLSDVRAEVRRVLNNIDTTVCDHEWEEKRYFQCKKCGEKSWVNPNHV